MVIIFSLSISNCNHLVIATTHTSTTIMAPITTTTTNAPAKKAVAPPLAKKKAVRRPSDTTTVVPVVVPAASAVATIQQQQQPVVTTKAKKFNEAEDELLCRAWVSSSMNSIDGTGKKAIDFWATVHAKYELLQLQSTDIRVNHTRDQHQLKTRFLRYIQPNVLKFNKFFKEAKDNVPSGTPDTDIYVMQEACIQWHTEEKKTWSGQL